MSVLQPPAGVKKTGGFAQWLTRLQMAHGRKLVIALPYLWLILLFLLPFLIVFKISLAEMARAIPPYTDLWEWADGQLTLTLNRRSALFRSLSAVAAGGGDFDVLLPAAGLSAGLGGGAQQTVHAKYSAAAGDPAIVDLIPDPRLCVDGAAEKQRRVE